MLFRVIIVVYLFSPIFFSECKIKTAYLICYKKKKKKMQRKTIQSTVLWAKTQFFIHIELSLSFINLIPFRVLLLLTVTEPCCLFRLVTKSKRAKRNFATLRWLDLIVITFSNGYSSLEMSLPLGCFVPVTKSNHYMMTDIPCYAPVSNM